MTSTTAKKTREHTDHIGPIKNALQVAFFTALTTGKLEVLDQAVRKQVEADPRRAQVAFDEVLEPVRTTAQPGPVLDLLNNLSTLVQPQPRLPGISRVKNRRLMGLLIPAMPGLEDVGAVKLSTFVSPSGKTMIVLEPFGEAEYQTMIKDIATPVAAGPASFLHRAA